LSWKNIKNSQNSVRKKSFGGTFTFSNCHIIGLDTVCLVFLVSGHGIVLGHYTYYTLGKPASAVCSSHDREDMLKIHFFKLSHNRVRYGRSSVSCLWTRYSTGPLYVLHFGQTSQCSVQLS
jgi:hypothetical protein